MGIIKAIGQAIGGTLADQWLEVIEADDMSDKTVFTSGVLIRKGQNTKGTGNTVSNGSIIHVYDNQFMMLVDGGKVVDYTAEPGYYKVDNSSLPSLFNGQFGDSLKDSFNRIKYGGQTPTAQKVFFINLQEIKGIKFGTRNPINYFDNFYNAELFLRAHGTYSVKITNPLQFYAEVIPRNADRVEIDEINEQYLSEFLEALQSSINQMSADGTRISYVTSKARELGKYMSTTLDEEWNQTRGMEIQAVGIASVSYDEESQKLINMRNNGYSFVSFRKLFQYVYCHIKALAVKRAETFVYKHCIGINSSGITLNYVGKPKGKAQRCFKSLSSGKGVCPTNFSRIIIQNVNVKPRHTSFICRIFTVKHTVSAERHFFKSFVCLTQYFPEIFLLNKLLKGYFLDSRKISAHGFINFHVYGTFFFGFF